MISRAAHYGGSDRTQVALSFNIRMHARLHEIQSPRATGTITARLPNIAIYAPHLRVTRRGWLWFAVYSVPTNKIPLVVRTYNDSATIATISPGEGMLISLVDGSTAAGRWVASTHTVHAA